MALGRITILVSEVGCELLVVGPSAEPWTLSLDVSISQSHCQCGNSGCQAGEVPWTERGTVATSYMLISDVGVWVSNRRWGPLAGLLGGCES